MGNDESFKKPLSDFKWIQSGPNATPDFTLNASFVDFEVLIYNDNFNHESELVYLEWFNIDRSPIVFEQFEYRPRFSITSK
jgi:hypothetical protein